MKNFELDHSKTDSRRLIARCLLKKCTRHVHASIDKSAKSFSIRKSFSKRTFNFSSA